MRKTMLRLLMFSSICLSSCGGGEDSPPAAAKAVITYSTSLAAGRTETFGSVEFTADLPPGVTVRTSNGVIDNGNLVIVGKALEVSSKAVLGTYAPASDGFPAKVHLALITLDPNGAGMSAGSFATLTCDVSTGLPVSASDFPQPANVVITDPAGVVIPAPEATVYSVTTVQ